MSSLCNARSPRPSRRLRNGSGTRFPAKTTCVFIIERCVMILCIFPHLRVCDVNMFLHAASAAVADAAAWRAARVRVDAWSYACVSRRWEAMPQRVLFRFRARLLRRTPASHDVGRPGRCACWWNRIIKLGALFLCSHFHCMHVTRPHVYYPLVIGST